MSRPTSWNEWETYRRAVDEDKAKLQRRIRELEEALAKSEKWREGRKQKAADLMELLEKVNKDSGFRNLHEPLQDEIVATLDGEP